MEMNEYQDKAMSTCMDSCANIIYSSFGLVAEVGEVCDKIAKFVRKGKISFDNNQMNYTADVTIQEYTDFMDGLRKEIGDVQWFVAHFAAQLGSSLDHIAQQNIDKLASRQQRGVIDGNGDNR